MQRLIITLIFILAVSKLAISTARIMKSDNSVQGVSGCQGEAIIKPRFRRGTIK